MTPGEETPIRQLLRRIQEVAPDGDPRLKSYLAELEREVNDTEKSQQDQEQLLAQYEAAYEKLSSPANRVGVFLKWLDDNGTVLVCQGDTEFVAMVDPNLNIEELTSGRRIRLNDAYAVVGVLDDATNGGIVGVTDVLEDGRLRVSSDPQGQSGRLIERSAGLAETTIKNGDEVRLDPSGRLAIEHLPKRAQRDYFLEEVPETPWSQIGGQEEAVALIRESLEYPMLHADLFAKYDKHPVKGILLYGPPGCGKTLIGKAVAYNLAREYSARVGHEVKEVFLNISGPKILNMWLGETERMVREIFATARERAKEGNLVVIFVDEAESLLRTRSSGRWMNISNTVVPQFCAEMDGLVALENVVVILTSNRPDYIDPAVLRPERIDRRVKVSRPDREGTKEILSLYLHENLPIDPETAKQHDGERCARLALIEKIVADIWRKDERTEFLRVLKRDASSETLYWSDFVSGALLKSVVDRAKDNAIRRALLAPDQPNGLTEDDLSDALRQEYAEGEIFPKNDALDDWLRLLDIDPSDVVGVQTMREKDPMGGWKKTII
ncbi:MAG: AAA family ATPase [Fimbriimonadaceae bacterium]|nr:AAA family ATPase [Fimbriimonadaceae bacterium]